MNLGTTERRNYLNSPYVRFILVVLAGLVLRIFLSMFLTYEPDFNTWRGWGAQISSSGFGEFYDLYWCDYMPGYLYVLRLLNAVHGAFPGIPVEILFKLPANLADVGITVMIFIVLRDITTVKNAMIASVVYLFNPATLSNSTFWGQIDSFHALPILLAIYFGLKKRYILSGVLAAAAFMIKPQSIIVFPVIGFLTLRPLIADWRKISYKTLLPPVLFGAAIITASIIITLPFIWDYIDSLSYVFTGPFELIKERFVKAYEQYNTASLNAFNFWGSFAMWESDQNTFLGYTFKTCGTLIFATLYAAMMSLLFRYVLLRRNSEGASFSYLILELVTLVLFSVFLFVTRAHERHLLPAIVFFTLIAFRAWKFWCTYAIVSCVYVVNMVYSYIQLTTEYQGVSTGLSQILSAGMFFLYLLSFSVILIDFIMNTVRYKAPINTLVSRT